MTDLQQHLQEIGELDDDSLLRSLKRHVGSSNRVNALVLAHLAEVDARGAYRKWACDTLATYCVYELRLSEDEAQRRCRAARVMRQFPVLFAMIADASIHLTGILLLAPYLTADNHLGVLARAQYRSKREIERLVAELAPSREVPALVEPLGVVSGSRTIPRKRWAALTESTLGWVRQLEPGDGPARAPSAPDDDDDQMLSDTDGDARVAGSALAGTAPGTADVPMVVTLTAPARSEDRAAGEPNGPVGALCPQLRYRVQFTADQAYVDLLERARALLWHQLPNGDLAELQRLALQALVEKLEKRKFGGHARANSSPSPSPAVAGPANTVASAAAAVASSPSTTDSAPAATEPAEPAAPARVDPPLGGSSLRGLPPHGSRHIAAAVRRDIWARDGGRCTFVDQRGQRCRATSAIEFHHEVPHARGGPATPANLCLRCRAHNQLAAEHDFGRSFMLGAQRGTSSRSRPPP